jgi:uncharacterized protein (DUF433 family)
MLQSFLTLITFDKNLRVMEYLIDRITIDSSVCSGKPTIRGKRITVQTILEYLSAGDSKEDILYQYPSLELEDINACLRFAAQLMNHQYSIKAIA